MAPATAAAAAQHLGERVAAGDDPGEQDRDDALEQVADHDDRGPLAAERAKGVGAARPPGPDGPRVRAAGEAGRQDAHRDRADEV